MEQERVDDWIETASGRKFHFMAPTADMIVLEDVALALSRTARYAGHTRRFYSVAEHTCVMADWVSRQPWATPLDALTALHHDDAEAYIGDLPRPAKQNVPQFKVLEELIDAAVAERFGTISPFPAWLKTADTAVLVDERAQVMRPSRNVWFTDGKPPLGVRLWGLAGRSSWWTRRQWLRRHHALTEACWELGYMGVDH